MQNQQKKHIPLGIFPAPTLSQLETLLDERQNKDRRQTLSHIHFDERRKKQRRTQNR